MGKLIDLTGRKFGRLTVLERAENTNDGYPKWKCVCDCGNEVVVKGSNLRQGRSTSCGCYQKEYTIKRSITHGGCGTRLYRIWLAIKKRCYNENSANYNNYGGRGISMCEAWKNSFEPFHDWAVENGYSDDLSIDRVDVNGNYEPSNCRWATTEEQANNRTDNHRITYNGKTQTISRWAEELGFSHYTIRSRLNQLGWTVEEALSTPVGQPRNKQDSI